MQTTLGCSFLFPNYLHVPTLLLGPTRLLKSEKVSHLHCYWGPTLIRNFRVLTNIQLWQSFSILNFSFGKVSDFFQYINPCLKALPVPVLVSSLNSLMVMTLTILMISSRMRMTMKMIKIGKIEVRINEFFYLPNLDFLVKIVQCLT